MNFSDFGFKKFINDALVELNFTSPTPIQEKIIPLIKKHNSVIGLANTGSGKSHSFLLPIINNLDSTLKHKIQFIIYAPTRELATQLHNNVKQIINYNENLSSALVVSGHFDDERLNLWKNNQPSIVVGTPQILRELYDKNILQLTTAKYVVVDECDMILDLDFMEHLDYVLSKSDLINMEISMFSATLAKGLYNFINQYLNKAILVDLIKNNVTPKNVEHILVWTRNKDNLEILSVLIDQINPFICLIFVNKKEHIKGVIDLLNKKQISQIGELHSNISNRQRDMLLKRIKNREFTYVVVSDVAARGIDIPEVSHVISLDLPYNIEYYIHRAGRSARQQNVVGHSYVFANYKNQPLVDKLKNMQIKFNEFKYETNRIISVNSDKLKKVRVKSINNQEQKIIGKYKNAKVKPGYKKKRKAEITELQRQIRREHIKESIAKIKKDKYTKRRKHIFE